MKLSWMAGAALAGAAALGALALKTHASENNSQLFTPARFSLVAAEVDAALLQNTGGDNGERKVLFKLDSVTGEVWVLQLSVIGGNDPRVTDANWYPVRRGAATAGTNSPDASGM